MFGRLSADQLWTCVEPILWLPISKDEGESSVESKNNCREFQSRFVIPIVYILRPYTPQPASNNR